MIILERFVDESEPHEISKKRFVELVEESGYCNDAIKTLKEAGMVFTPFAVYTIKKQKLTDLSSNGENK